MSNAGRERCKVYSAEMFEKFETFCVFEVNNEMF